MRRPVAAGHLRESVLHRNAQYCNLVRGRPLISQLKQSVSFQHPDSGGRGRRFKSSHPDQVQKEKGPFNLLGPFFFLGLGGIWNLPREFTKPRSGFGRTKCDKSSHPDQIQIRKSRLPHPSGGGGFFVWQHFTVAICQSNTQYLLTPFARNARPPQWLPLRGETRACRFAKPAGKAARLPGRPPACCE